MSHNSKGLNEVLTKEYLIEEHYNKGKTIRQIAREHNCSHSNIRKHLKKNGLESQTQMKGHDRARVYSVNDDYFKVIDSDDKAYWFGLLYADGYIQRKSGTNDKIRFLLTKKDKYLVEQLRDELGDMPVRTYTQKGTGHKSVFFDLFSQEMVDDLESKNMTAPKNERVGLPIIEDAFFYPFLLGLFDGDGSIVTSNNIPTVSILGHLELVGWVKSRLENDGFVFNGINIHNLGGIYRLSFSSQRNIPLFFKKMYVDISTPHLIRKRKTFEEYLSSMKI